uniref:Ig-like domain-containing protein n=1 Tax=Amphilophus citrinellus TaxID=61819 RepID=A0A3Q0R754_AMPCI
YCSLVNRSLMFAVFSLCFNPTELKVKPGEDAFLQCQSLGGGSIILLEWSRPELKSDSYVFFFRNNRPYEKYQHESFKGRVELRDPSMKDGDVSVIVRNVSIRDTGTYDCEITTRDKESVTSESKYSVNLTVTDSGEDRDKTVSVIVVVFVFVVLILIVVWVIKRANLMLSEYKCNQLNDCGCY